MTDLPLGRSNAIIEKYSCFVLAMTGTGSWKYLIGIMVRRPMRIKKPKSLLSPSQKKEARRIKSRLRREARKSGSTPGEVGIDPTRPAVMVRTLHQEDQFWAQTKARSVAMKVLNNHRHRPYWLSIPHAGHNPPVAGYFPCSMFQSQGRWYFGFLFREHRDDLHKKWSGARKELTNVGSHF